VRVQVSKIFKIFQLIDRKHYLRQVYWSYMRQKYGCVKYKNGQQARKGVAPPPYFTHPASLNNKLQARIYKERRKRSGGLHAGMTIPAFDDG
jgi:hypothetical protein